MGIPNVTNTILDGGLGIIPSSNGVSAMAAIGVCSLGTPNTLYSFSGIDLSQVQAALGEGPLTEEVAQMLMAGASTVYAMPTTVSNGSVGSVTHVGTGTAIFALATHPNDSYTVSYKIINGATNLAAAAATMQISYDNGNTWGPTLAIPTNGSYADTFSGLTLTITDGTFVAGDTYTFVCTEPTYSGANVEATLTALCANPATWKVCHIVGHQQTNIAAMVTIAGALQTIMNASASSRKYARIIIESPTDTDANTISGWANFVGNRVAVGGGLMTQTSVVHGFALQRNAAWAVAQRLSFIQPVRDVGAFIDGPIGNVSAISRDENATPGLDAARLCTLRTITNVTGFYITNFNLMANAGSDFSLGARGCVMDIAATVAYSASLPFLNIDLDISPTTGQISPQDIDRWQKYVTRQLYTTLITTKQASAVQFAVSTSDNLLSTNTVHTKVRVIPRGYAKYIDVEIGFTNPLLSLPTS